MPQTGAISFCDRVHHNLKSSDTKAQLLRRLEERYQLRIIARHWHRLDDQSLPQLARSRHWLCLRSNGNPYYLVFTRIEGVATVIYVDKKVQPGYEFPRMILTKGRFGDDLFEDTVLEGEMVRDTRGGWVFLVNDVAAYCGRSLRREPLPARLERAVELFAAKHTPDGLMDTCLFHVKDYCAASQEGCTALLEAAADLPYTLRGIYLWPDDTRYKPKLYNFNESLIQPVVRKVKDEPAFQEAAPAFAVPAIASPPPPPVAAAPALAAAPGPASRRMWLRKTENPDIYDVYAGANGCEAVGVAAVPTMATSKLLRACFKNKTVAAHVAFDCHFHARFQKWVPLAEA